MIKVKHPIESCNIEQETFINSLSEKEREYHSILFSYGNATFQYHNLPIERTPEDYNDWLEGLDENFRKAMQEKGFETCKSILSFTRYVREIRDVDMEGFVKEKMGNDEFQKYKKLFENKEE